MKDETLIKHSICVYNISSKCYLPATCGYTTFEKDVSYTANIDKNKLSVFEALERAEWFDTNNKLYDREIKQIVRNAINSDTLCGFLICWYKKELYKDKFCSEYLYLLKDKNLNSEEFIVARITYDSSGYLVDVVLDLYWNLVFDEYKNLSCWVFVQGESISLFPFFNFYLDSVVDGEFEGIFSEFLNCDKTDEFVTMFRLLNY